MSALAFAKSELAAALNRGVRQCVVIGKRPFLTGSLDPTLQVFAVDESATETLAAALDKSEFDKLKASLFVWLGGAGYRTVDAMIASLAFIASLPKGSGVLLDYAVERTSLGTLTNTALDALASRLSSAGGTVKYLIQPQAVEALLRGVGFRQIIDLASEEPSPATARLVSATV